MKRFLSFAIAVAFITTTVMAETININGTSYAATRTTKQVASGVKYITLEIPNKKASSNYSKGAKVHILEADLTDPTVSVRHGDSGRDSRRTLAVQAANMSTSTSTVVGGVNANFWITSETPYNAKLQYEPFGASIKDGIIYSDPNQSTIAHVGGPASTTGLFLIDGNGRCYIDYLKARTGDNATGSGWNFTITNKTHPHTFGLDQVNGVSCPGTASLYIKSVYGSSKTFRSVVSASNYATWSGSTAVEVLMDFASGTTGWNLGGDTKLVIKAIRKNTAGNGTLGNYACGIVCRDSYATVAKGWAVGDEITITAKVNFKSKGTPSKIMQATSGNCICMENGKIGFNSSQNNYNNKYYPRTIYATNNDGTKLWLIVCEHYPNRQYTYSGLTTTEITYVAKHIGATWATQMDCGGSAQMYAGGKQVSTSMDSGGVRSVQSGVFIVSTPGATSGGVKPDPNPTDPTTPSIKSDPTSVSLSAVYGAATQPYKDVTITATGLEADMIHSSSTSGIVVTELSGWNARTGGKLRFTLNTNFVSGAGEYLEGKYVAVESGSGTSKTRIEIPVAFTLTASGTDQPAKNPTITVTPASLSFSGEEGATIASQKVTVTGKDLSAAPTVSGATDKFTVTSSLTATGGTITVAPKATLAAGTHTGTLTIAATGATSKTVSLTATITAKQVTPNPNPGNPDATYGAVKFYLQGGTLAVPTDNAALWEEFKPAYNTYYNLARSDQPIEKVTTFAPEKMQDFMTNTNSAWKWLGDHVLATTTAEGRTIDTEVLWRFGVSAFFNCAPTAASTWNGNADFTQAGKPVVWQPLYTFAHKPTKSGATFCGWFDNAAGTGSVLTSCPSSGNVYACWKANGTTDIENVIAEVHILPTANGVEIFFEGTAPVAIYNINGTTISNIMATNYYTCDLQAGMYIIRIGSDTYKFVK